MTLVQSAGGLRPDTLCRSAATCSPCPAVRRVPTTLDADVNHFVSEIHVVSLPSGFTLLPDGSFGPLPPAIEHEQAAAEQAAPVIQELPPEVVVLKPRES
jgi:hypothetical protein